MSDEDWLSQSANVYEGFPSPCGELRVSDHSTMESELSSPRVKVSVPLRGIEGV